MKCAVLYYSETGNTEKIAERIYETIGSSDKKLVDLQSGSEIPSADIYFVGFPIHKKNCSMRIVDALEQIDHGKIALFATCGMTPAEKYKQKLEDALSIWLPDDVEYLGMFLCQGSTTESQKEYFYDANPEYQEKIREMLEEGNSHPDEADLEHAAGYAKKILQNGI
jgi:flavodoxin